MAYYLLIFASRKYFDIKIDNLQIKINPFSFRAFLTFPAQTPRLTIATINALICAIFHKISSMCPNRGAKKYEKFSVRIRLFIVTLLCLSNLNYSLRI